jgi:tetratricopeptide (TPR) repeat protein
MNHDLYVRRHSARTDARPAILWLALTMLLLANACIGFLIVRALTGDWLELKMESARVRVLEMLPQPERPDFVPTPILQIQNDAAPTIEWSKKLAPTSVAETATPPAVPVVAMQNPTPRPSPVPTDFIPLKPIQPAVELAGVTHEAQRFNNCGPTTLRMYLSYFGYTRDSQVQIANVLKPNKDDRNVSPNELTGYAQSKGFRALVRVNGNLERLKQILSNDLPVMIEEGYDPPRAKQGWMGHYLLLTGYDDAGIIAQDSYNGPNQRVAWSDVDDHWRNFNRTYLLFYTDAQEQMVRAIVGEEMDDDTMYAQAAQRAQDEWNAHPQDAFAAFNLGSSLVGLGEYEAAANAFDRARLLKLPWRMMWYQFGPYEAYYRVGRYDEVIALADATLKPTGDLEESYYYKGLALQKLGRSDEARAAFQEALKYNANYRAARQALQELGL